MRIWKLGLIAGVVTIGLLGGTFPARAYLSDIKPLEKTEIVKLTDDQLVDAYIDVLVNLEASRTFHLTSGFGPKEYDDFKSLLRYRYLLIMEINKRGLDVPPMDALPEKGHPK